MTIHVGSLWVIGVMKNHNIITNIVPVIMPVPICMYEKKKDGPFHKKFITTFVIDVSHLSGEISTFKMNS